MLIMVSPLPSILYVINLVPDLGSIFRSGSATICILIICGPGRAFEGPLILLTHITYLAGKKN